MDDDGARNGSQRGATATRWVEAHDATRRHDALAVEEPLALEVDGEPMTVLMRTPGDDRALCAGFLVTEGVVALDAPEDLAHLGPCPNPEAPHAHNTWLARLGPGVSAARRARAKRVQLTTAACGVCGKTQIDHVFLNAEPLDPAPEGWRLPATFVAEAGETMRACQALFAATGSVHGAALVAFEPGVAWRRLAQAEDVGRHNAVDKAVGRAWLDGALPSDAPTALWVSGRASFEMVQKALVAGCRALVAVGAPTSLAVDLATEAGVTLVGFATAGRYNVYAGELAR